MSNTYGNSGYIAGIAVCSALLANDLLIFGNLNLNTASIVMLVTIGLACGLGLLINIKKKQSKP